MQGTKRDSDYVKKYAWSAEEDQLLVQHIKTYGEGRWSDLPRRAGLIGRSPQSCRFRWKNYLRPNIKHGAISPEEEDLILRLHRLLGNRWALIAGRVPGRTDNQIKNFWYTQKRRKHGLQGKAESPLTRTNAENSAGQVDYMDGFLGIDGFGDTENGSGEEDSLLLERKHLDFKEDFEIELCYSDLLEIMEILQGN